MSNLDTVARIKRMLGGDTDGSNSSQDYSSNTFGLNSDSGSPFDPFSPIAYSSPAPYEAYLSKSAWGAQTSGFGSANRQSAAAPASASTQTVAVGSTLASGLAGASLLVSAAPMSAASKTASAQPLDIAPTQTLANGSTLVGASGGLQFDLVWDPSVASAPAGFKSAAIAAASYFSNMFSNKEVVNIAVGYGEVGGASMGGDLSDSYRLGTYESYASVSTALKKDAGDSSIQAQADSTLPATDPLGSAKSSPFGPLPNYYTTYADAKALGLWSAAGTEIDGQIGLSSSLPFSYTEPVAKGTYDAIGCFEYEISSIMGRISSEGSLFGSGDHTPFDLFRFDAIGARDKGAGASDYFSIDDGKTRLAPFTNQFDPNAWAPPVYADAFGYQSPGATDTVSPVDLAALAVIGYDPTPAGLAATKVLTPLA